MDAKLDFSITAGALTKARKKLKHTAYIELNDDIVNIYYDDDNIKKFRGFRVLAFDGSRITLPKSNEVELEFGSIPIGNKTNENLGTYSRAIYLACYDSLNNIAVKSVLGRGDAYEVALASEMIGSLNEKDLLIFDRGYASYQFMANLTKNQKTFIIRCPRSSTSEINKMFEPDAPESKTITISAPNRQKKKIKALELPQSIKLRLVRVILTTGEVEVLATTLFDENNYIPADFKYLYSLRWGAETFFGRIKGRLALENFTGKTVESIYQDFWSTIFISNLETILTEDVEEKINADAPIENKKKKINKAVSFNAIKNMAFEIFYREPDKNKVIDKITKLFVMNPVTVRANRQVPRKKISDTKSLGYQKRVRKHVF